MKTYILVILVLLLHVPVFGQEIADMSKLGLMKSDPIPKNNVDKAKYVVVYDYECVRNPDKPSVVKKGLTILEIGTRYNRFCDYNRMRFDSLNDATVGASTTQNDYQKLMDYLKGKLYDESIVFDLKNNKALVQCTAGGLEKYQYEEDVLGLDWQLVEGDTIIRDYHCNKATVSFRGRDYVAWYAPEIEMPFGPYKFNGLPGLVLKVGDTRGHYTFSVRGIERVKYDRPIYKWAHKDIVKTDRAKVRKIYYNFCADPTSAMGGQDNVRISETALRRVKSRPYNPIELE